MTPQQIYQLLNDNKIEYQVVHHPAVFTTDEADQYVQNYSFARTKNLFLHTHNRKIISYIFFQKISASMKKALVRQLDHPDYHLLPQMK